MMQVSFAFRRQADASRRAIDQPHTQSRFELRQPFRGGRGRQVQLARRRRQAAVPGQQHKEFKRRCDVILHCK